MIQLAYHRHVLFKRVVTMCVEDGLTWWWCPVCVYFIIYGGITHHLLHVLLHNIS